MRTSVALDDYNADAYNSGGYGEGDDYNAGGYGNEDLFGAGVGTRDFLSMGPGSSAQGGYAGFTAGAYSNIGSSSLRPSRLDFNGLDLNSEHGWSEVQDLLRGDEVQGSDLPPPIRVPPRGQNRTLGLCGPRSGRGGGQTAAADLAPVEALHLRLHKVAGLHPLGAQTCLQGVLRLDLKRRQPTKPP